MTFYPVKAVVQWMGLTLSNPTGEGGWTISWGDTAGTEVAALLGDWKAVLEVMC